MRNAVIMAVILFLLSAALFAQSSDAPKAVIFGGYTYLNNSNSLSSLGSTIANNSSDHFNGWDGQFTYNFVHHLGLTADINGNYRTPIGFSTLGFTAGTTQSLYNFLFGPTVSTDFGRLGLFGHALFGESVSRLSAGVSVPIIGGLTTSVSSANAFAMAFGGGVDIGLTRHISIRAGQFDYLRTQFSPTEALASGLSSSSSGRQNSFRYSGGIILRF